MFFGDALDKLDKPAGVNSGGVAAHQSKCNQGPDISKKNSEKTLPSDRHRGLPMGRTIYDWRMGNDDIIAKVKRISDQKIFEIGLSWLECTDFKHINYRTFGADL